MFPNILIRRANLPTCQQVRFARKTIGLHFRYGKKPIIDDNELINLKEEGELDNLKYEKIRFAVSTETSSLISDPEVEKFVRYVMRDGRKELAHNLIHDAFHTIKNIQFTKFRKQAGTENPEAIEVNPLEIFKTALKNCEPVVVTKKVKRGGATYQVPYPITKSDSKWYATRWLIEAVKERPKPRKKNFGEVMAQELLDAYYMRGKVIKRKDDMHRLADANKAYAHYRWG